MSTNINPQDINPDRIAKLLTRATEQLDDDTVAALRQARNAALERQTINEPVFALGTGHRAHWLMPHSAHQWAATAILFVAILVGGVSYWHHAHENEMSHLDVAILTDDLPMEVFVD
ncbi:MAG: hypothetical protein A3K04_00775 [Gallionellales bacterium RBG_16_56_9]|nr:MAG: hypothetical protein A3K04_00775 [Gallionellales bacterium RBG_16_56_9]